MNMGDNFEDRMNVIGWFIGALFIGLILIQAAAKYGELPASFAWIVLLIIGGFIWRNSRRRGK